MRFVLRMAVRETRASWRRLLFFFLCIAVGVGAIAALRSVIQNVRAALAGEARNLIASDVVISSTREFPAAALDRIARRLHAGGVQARTESIETATMMRPADPDKPVARMVELRGVKGEFPLYGSVKLAGGKSYSHRLLENRGVLVRPELLAQLGIDVGEQVIIGGQTFSVRGIIEREPGRRVGGFSLGPRVLIDHDALVGLGLLTFGSRARRQILLRVDEQRIAPLTDQLREDLKETFISVRSFQTTRDDIGEDLGRAEGYLSLAGLTVLVLGGIGVSSVTRVFIEQKLRSIAILKCVGADSWRITSVYLVQVIALGFGGSLVGLVLARLALAAAPDTLGAANEGVRLSHELTPSAAGQAVAIGLLVSLLFCLVPLLRVRHIRPSLLLRDDTSVRVRRDWVRAAALLGVGACLVWVAAWQAGSLRVGLTICIGFALLAGVLHLAGLGLVRAVTPFSRSRRFIVRHAALHLNRPGNQTRVVLLAVGLGSFVLIGIHAVRANLLREFALALDADSPDLFLVDVQADQRDGVASLVRQHTGRQLRLLPVLRARVTQVRGRETNLDGIDDVRGRGSLAREYTITYRSGLERNERIIAGEFWNGTPSSVPEVSIEESIRDRFQINPGDTIRFDVLGRSMSARVTSVREVNWRDNRAGGFMFVFRPGVLETAPHWYIAPLRGPSTVAGRARMQRDLAAAYPNVSAIDVREILDTIQSVTRQVALAMSVIGGLVLFTGVLILIGAVAVTKFRRLHDAAILKTLGASSRQVGGLLLVEYGLLGVLAGTIGAAGGAALSWAVSRYVFEIRWHAPLVESLAGVGLTALLVALVGLMASVDVLRKKPLATLRAE